MLILTVVTGPDQGAVYRLSGDRAHRIGRRHGSVPLNDKGTSSKHAELSADNGVWSIRDMGSSNGTYVNKERIDAPVVLEDGDRIQVGRSMLVFNIVDEADLDHGSDVDHESGAHATMHAAIAAQQRNQELLTEVRDLLAQRGADAAAVSVSPDAVGSPADLAEMTALMQRVLDRLDRLPAAAPADSEPDPRIDVVIDQLKQLRQREQVAAAEPPAVDLGPVLDAIDHLRAGQKPPERIDLSPLVERLDRLVREADRPAGEDQPSAPEPVDLTPVLDRIDALRQDRPDVDLAPVLERIDRIEQLAAERPQPEPVDLAPVLDAIGALRDTQKPAEAVDLQPVLDAVAELREAQTPAAPVDLTPVLDALNELRERDEQAERPEPIDLQPLHDAINELKTSTQPTDLAPVLDAIRELREADGADTAERVVDLTPVIDGLRELRERTEQRPDAEPVDLQPVLDAIAELRAVQKPAEPVDLAPVLDAIAQARPADPAERLDQLTQRIDKLHDVLDAARTHDDAPADDGHLDEMRQKLDALAQQLTDVTGKLDRPADTADAAPSEELAALGGRLDDLRSKLNDLTTARLDEKLDQLLDIATTPGDHAPPAADPAVLEKLEQVLGAIREQAAAHTDGDDEQTAQRITELRAAVDALGSRLDASSDSPGAADLAPQITQRLDSLAAQLAERDTAGSQKADAAVAEIGERIEAIVDVLRAMPAVAGEPGAATAPGVDAEDIAEINAKLEVIFEALQQQAGRGAEVGGEIDNLLQMVRDEHSATDAEAALGKVLARLDRLETPAPTVDHELLERLEIAARRLDQLNLPDVDLSTLALNGQLEPLIRQIHDRVTAGEAVDLSDTNRRLAELNESVRDATNRTDRPLLEQILVEIRQSQTEQPDADKLELILERVSRIGAVGDLAPMVNEIKAAVDAGSNDKIVALLRQLIEHVQQMPAKFDGRDTLGNIFESLRRLEQAQEQTAATLRRVVASIADAASHAPAPVTPDPAPRQIVSIAPARGQAGRSSVSATARTDYDDAVDPEIDAMMAGSDPNVNRSPSLLVKIVLIAAIPLAIIFAALAFGESGLLSEMRKKVAPAEQPAEPDKPSDGRTDVNADAGGGLTRR